MYLFHFNKDIPIIEDRLEHAEIQNEKVHHITNKYPNSKFTTKIEGESVLNEINSYGMRGPELRPKSGKRILIVGDSFVEADEVFWEETFSERLNENFSGRIEFLAHGVTSWAPTTIFSWIYHYGLALHPDEIYIFTCWNDFVPEDTYQQSDAAYRSQVIWDCGVPFKYVNKSSKLRLECPALYAMKMLALKCGNSLNVAKLLYLGWNKGVDLLLPPLSEQNAMIAFSEPSSKWPQKLKNSVDQTIETIDTLNTYLRKRGINFVVTLVPTPLQWSDELMVVKRTSPKWVQIIAKTGMTPEKYKLTQDGLYNYFQKEIERRGIEWLDLRSGFDLAKQECDRLLYYAEDGHWNGFGHQVVFEVLKNRY